MEEIKLTGSLAAGSQAIFCRIGRGITIVVLAILPAMTGCAWLDVKQRLIIYRPTLGVPADFAGLRAQDQRYFVSVDNSATPPLSPDAGRLDAPQQAEIWWLPHEEPGAPSLLYLHGTFRNLYQNVDKINALRQAGFSVLAVDYRGWGRSSAIVPSEKSIVQDAGLAWRELVKHEPDASRRVIFGHSMGSGVAVGLASRLEPKRDFAAVILESAFTSFSEVSWQAGLIAGVLANFNAERFDSLSRIASIRAPLLMIHGSADTTVPQVLGERLFAAAGQPKQWVSISGGTHSGLQKDAPDLYQATLREFVQIFLADEKRATP